MKFLSAFAITGALGILAFLFWIGNADAQSACIQALDGNATINASWDSDCLSENISTAPNSPAPRYYARFYTFTLNEPSYVIIYLASATNTYLYLMEGAGKNGAVLHENDDAPGGGTNSRIEASLLAGDYTIEATTFNAETAGDFTLTVAGLPDASPPIPTATLTATTIPTATPPPGEDTPTPVPTPTTEPIDTPEPAPTQSPVPVPSVTPTPPSGDLDMTEANCIPAYMPEGFVRVSISGPERYSPNPWGIVATYRTDWEAPNSANQQEISCLTVVYRTVSDARWGMTYSNALQLDGNFNPRWGDIQTSQVEHEQIVVSQFGDDAMGTYKASGTHGRDGPTIYWEEETVYFIKGKIRVSVWLGYKHRTINPWLGGQLRRPGFMSIPVGIADNIDLRMRILALGIQGTSDIDLQDLQVYQVSELAHPQAAFPPGRQEQ